VSGLTAERSGSSADTAVPPQSADAPAGTVVESAPTLPPPSEAPAAPPVPSIPPAPGTVATSPSVPVSSAAMPASSGADALVFVASADSWITVTDATGKALLRRIVTPGETVGLSGTLPLSVVVGHAAGVTVQVKGKPFDLTPLARSGGVARFEVKP
jgi:cytoskeleton protein RodZ